MIELLVVIAIIAVLMALLLPSLSRARFNARKVICASGYRQMAIAISSYAGDNQDYLPTFYTNGWAGNPWDTNAGYYYALAPYLEGEEVFWCPVVGSASGSMAGTTGAVSSRWLRFGGGPTYYATYAAAVASGSFLNESPSLRGGTPYQTGNHNRIWFARPTPQGGMWTDQPGQWAQLYQPGGYNFAGVRRLSQSDRQDNPILADEVLGYRVTPAMSQLTTLSAATAVANAAGTPGAYLRMSHMYNGRADSNTALWPDGHAEVRSLADMRCGCPYGDWSGWR